MTQLNDLLDSSDPALVAAGRSAAEGILAEHPIIRFGLQEHPMATGHKTCWTMAAFLCGVACAKGGYADDGDVAALTFMSAALEPLYAVGEGDSA